MTRKESNCVVETQLLAEPPFAPRDNAAVMLLPQRSIASIAAFEHCLSPLQDALGLALPGPGRQAHHDDILYLWTGPENWLAISAEDDPDFDLKLAKRCNGLAAITDQSDGRSILQIAGPLVRNALAKLLPIDLHPSAFPTNATALTLAGHIPVQIWQSAEDAFALACFRSYAETLYEALIEANRF
jgi:methylglutamate dehydrogenase subunit D